MAIIVGIKVSNREHSSAELQEILTSYGCYIKTRLGLHDTSSDKCFPNGIVLLELTDNKEAEKLIKDLNKNGGFEVQTMIFE